MGIDNLTTATAISAGDLVPLFSQAGGEDMKASLTAIAAAVSDILDLGAGALATQVAAPSSTGFSVAISAGDTWLLLTPTGAFAAGTIVFPATVADGDNVQVTTTQAVTALTVNGNGKTVTGAPTTLAANGTFGMRYHAITGAWYRAH